MNPADFVREQIYKGALAKGASESAAVNHADRGLDDYNKHRIETKVYKLIESRIKAAVKETKKGMI